MNFTEVRSPVPSMRVWRAQHSPYSFVITLEQLPIPGWHGYTASYKHELFASAPANRIGDRFTKFEDAAAACRDKLKGLTQ